MRTPAWAAAEEFGVELAPGETVGNRLAGFCGEVPTPGTVVTVPGTTGRAGSTGEVGTEVGTGVVGADEGCAAAITIVAAAWKDAALVPLAVAVNVILAPGDAALATLTVACSSSD